jgi:hypothetical protein
MLKEGRIKVPPDRSKFVDGKASKRHRWRNPLPFIREPNVLASQFKGDLSIKSAQFSLLPNHYPFINLSG